MLAIEHSQRSRRRLCPVLLDRLQLPARERRYSASNCSACRRLWQADRLLRRRLRVYNWNHRLQRYAQHRGDARRSGDTRDRWRHNHRGEFDRALGYHSSQASLRIHGHRAAGLWSRIVDRASRWRGSRQGDLEMAVLDQSAILRYRAGARSPGAPVRTAAEHAAHEAVDDRLDRLAHVPREH